MCVCVCVDDTVCVMVAYMMIYCDDDDIHCTHVYHVVITVVCTVCVCVCDVCVCVCNLCVIVACISVCMMY